MKKSSLHGPARTALTALALSVTGTAEAQAPIVFACSPTREEPANTFYKIVDGDLLYYSGTWNSLCTTFGRATVSKTDCSLNMAPAAYTFSYTRNMRNGSAYRETYMLNRRTGVMTNTFVKTDASGRTFPPEEDQPPKYCAPAADPQPDSKPIF